MRIIYNSVFLDHDIIHPENKGRLKYFYHSKETDVPNGEEYLPLAHSQEMIARVREVSARAGSLDSDTLTCNRSYESACFAVGASVMAAKENAFALVRPPGHHATRTQSMGFCLFNNMAITAKYLSGEGKRVFIFDFDIHHGNGTEEIVSGDKRIFYFSTHQSPLYPGTGLSSGFNHFNIPLPFATDDDPYIEKVIPVLTKTLREFNPDIVGISAGFDSYYKDFGYMNPAAGFKLTDKSYIALKEALFQYPCFMLLEGGYNPESIKEGVEIFTGDF